MNDHISGTSWEMTTLQGGDWRISPKISQDYSGVGPKNNGDFVPDWFEIPFDLTLGALHPAVATLLVLDDVMEMTKVSNNLQEKSDGWTMNHTSAIIGNWKKASHCQRFTVEVPMDYDPYADHLEVISRGKESGINGSSAEVAFEVSFGSDELSGPIVGLQSTSRTNLSADGSSTTLAPDKIEQSDKFKTKMVDPSTLPSNLQQEVVGDQSELSTQGTVDEVMFISEWPIGISAFTKN
ncbi:hypothetical protein [Natrinema sp. DC36]|uniref:hypothetical protein n=1 Tax=Natrinema sp. DC36 TaxID=2878680 RepID=UPI001CEFB87C|nr:hypothetical protein [Natrinema sp. DC36]